MSELIRGKIESDREVHPKKITFGESPFKEINGRWVNVKDPGKEVKEVRWSELIGRLNKNNKTHCYSSFKDSCAFYLY